VGWELRMFLQVLSHHLPLVLAGGPVQNPAPADPAGGPNGVNLLLAYAK
jgi:hypothetical protein